MIVEHKTEILSPRDTTLDRDRPETFVAIIQTRLLINGHHLLKTTLNQKIPCLFTNAYYTDNSNDFEMRKEGYETRLWLSLGESAATIYTSGLQPEVGIL